LCDFPQLRWCSFFHLSGKDRTGGLGWQFLPFGQPAVDVFFVLSGFVIAYVVVTKEGDFKSYLVSRAARLYSVAISALILTLGLCLVGRKFRPDYHWGDGSPFSYLRAATFTNELWFSNVAAGNNGVFWSLGYEAFYYALFDAAIFPPRRLRIPSLAIIAIVAGPRILLLLPLWLMGVGAYWFIRRDKLTALGGASIWVASALLLLAGATWQITERRKTLWRSVFSRLVGRAQVPRREDAPSVRSNS
jgi:peptidoglycan/LPS O-acetylase OafA/YrhL